MSWGTEERRVGKKRLGTEKMLARGWVWWRTQGADNSLEYQDSRGHAEKFFLKNQKREGERRYWLKK